MFKNLNEFFGDENFELDTEGEPTSRDTQICVVVMLSALSHADGEFEEEEISSIMGTMFREFGLADHEAGELLEISNFLVNDKAKLDQFFEKINARFSPEQKQLLLSMLWKVVMSDGSAEAAETTAISQIRAKLGLSMEQSVRARKLAEIDQVQSMAIKFANQAQED